VPRPVSRRNLIEAAGKESPIRSESRCKFDRNEIVPQGNNLCDERVVELRGMRQEGPTAFFPARRAFRSLLIRVTFPGPVPREDGADYRVDVVYV